MYKIGDNIFIKPCDLPVLLKNCENMTFLILDKSEGLNTYYQCELKRIIKVGNEFVEDFIYLVVLEDAIEGKQ